MSSIEHASNPHSTSSPLSSQIQRLTGLDLFRGIAALAVVLLHADEGLTVRSPAWSFILQFSAFAVPFFLAASFYLTINKLCNSPRSFNWQNRFERLFIPFLSWCFLYSGWKLLKDIGSEQDNPLQSIFKELPSLLILGKAGFAFHLYFIPLLLMGTFLLFWGERWLKKQRSLNLLIGLVFISLLLHGGYNTLPLQTVVSSKESALFFLLTLLGYALRCLPYIFISLLLIHPRIQQKIIRLTHQRYLLALSCLFILLNSFDFSPFFSPSGYEILRAYSGLFLALSISYVLHFHPTIASISGCSFGIYLSHLLILKILWSGVKKLGWLADPISIGVVLLIAILAFGISWGVTVSLSQQKHLARVLFGS